jgi:hypothetical protein
MRDGHTGFRAPELVFIFMCLPIPRGEGTRVGGSGFVGKETNLSRAEKVLRGSSIAGGRLGLEFRFSLMQRMTEARFPASADGHP